eukprot:Partr_v1_DN26648_c2_g1_i1_m69536 putative RING finger protein
MRQQAFADIYSNAQDGCILNSTFSIKPDWALILRSGNCTISSKISLAKALSSRFLLICMAANDTIDPEMPLDSPPAFPVALLSAGACDSFTSHFLVPVKEGPERVIRLSLIAAPDYYSGIWEFALFVITILLGMSFTASILMHLRLYRLRRSRLEAQRIVRELEERNRPLLTREDLEKYPICSYQSIAMAKTIPQTGGEEDITQAEDAIEDHNTCAICIEDYGEDDLIRQLPCKHTFHSTCIDPWVMEKNASCPLCKLSLAPPDRSTSHSDMAVSEESSSDGGVLDGVWNRIHTLVRNVRRSRPAIETVQQLSPREVPPMEELRIEIPSAETVDTLRSQVGASTHEAVSRLDSQTEDISEDYHSMLSVQTYESQYVDASNSIDDEAQEHLT